MFNNKSAGEVNKMKVNRLVGIRQRSRQQVKAKADNNIVHGYAFVKD